MLGATGSLSSVNLTDIRVESLFKGKTPVLRIKGVYGANVLETHYFYLLDHKPVALLVVDGNLYEADLDNDGSLEVIASSGIPQETTIYKYMDGRYQEANLNRQLKATAVSYHPNTKTFEAVYQGQAKPVRFKYQPSGSLQPLTS